MFLEYLPEPVAELLGSAVLALDDENLVAPRAFSRGGQTHLERGNQFRFLTHLVMLP